MSVRAFKSDPVPGEVVRRILETAHQAPSGGNLQPWRVYALSGEPLARFKALAVATLSHRLIVNPGARVKHTASAMIVGEILDNVPVPGTRPLRSRR